MGQLALGFRSLLIKSAVFVVMAALLAWILGGTLFPRAETAQLEPVTFQGQNWFWQLAVGGKHPGAMRWHLMHNAPGQPATPFDERAYAEVAGPLVSDGRLYFAALVSHNPNEPWLIHAIDAEEKLVETHSIPDRLSVEIQFVRLARGLPVADIHTSQQYRSHLLDLLEHSDDDLVEAELKQ